MGDNVILNPTIPISLFLRAWHTTSHLQNELCEYRDFVSNSHSTCRCQKHRNPADWRGGAYCIDCAGRTNLLVTNLMLPMLTDKYRGQISRYQMRRRGAQVARLQSSGRPTASTVLCTSSTPSRQSTQRTDTQASIHPGVDVLKQLAHKHLFTRALMSSSAHSAVILLRCKLLFPTP